MDPEVIGPDGELIEIGDRTVAQTIADEELVRRVMDAEKRVGFPRAQEFLRAYLEGQMLEGAGSEQAKWVAFKRKVWIGSMIVFVLSLTVIGLIWWRGGRDQKTEPLMGDSRGTVEDDSRSGRSANSIRKPTVQGEVPFRSPRQIKSVIYYYRRGNARMSKGDLAGAIEDCSKAIELDPRLASAYITRGAARKEQGDLPGSILDYNKAIELDPKYAKAYYNRGSIREYQGNCALRSPISRRPSRWLRQTGATARGPRATSPEIARSWPQVASRGSSPPILPGLGYNRFCDGK